MRSVTKDGHVTYYTGPKDDEVPTRRVRTDGGVEYYKRVAGGRGRYAKTHTVKANGDVDHYEGDDRERLVRRNYADGGVAYYEGDWLDERLVRLELARGTVFHYENGKTVRAEHADGDVSHYEDDRLRRRECASGAVRHYEGMRGYEWLARCEEPNGEVWHYEQSCNMFSEVSGEREQLVRITRADGKVEHYEGDPGHEYKVREIDAHGNQFVFFENDEERLYCIYWADGDVCYYSEPQTRAPRADGVFLWPSELL